MIQRPSASLWVIPLTIFVVARLVSGLLLLVVGHDQISSAQLPSNMPMPTLVDPPSYLHLIANWDGQWYRHIAAHGYPHRLPVQHGTVQQSAWAFYPLFPAAVRVLMAAGLSFGVAASVISLTSGALAMCVLFRLLQTRTGLFTASVTVLAVCVAPASAILQSAYAESLALFLLFFALNALEQRRHLAFGIAGVLLSLTRAIAPPLALVGLAVYVMRRRSPEPFVTRERRGLLVSCLIVATSSLLWPITVGIATGDATAYVKTQAAWATVAGNEAKPWLLTMLTNPAQAVAVVIGVGVLELICVAARSWPLVLRLWPLPYAAFLLAVTPATASVLRFSMLAGATWWPVPDWSRRFSTSARVVIVCAVFTIGLAFQWWWLRTYFVIDPYSHGHP